MKTINDYNFNGKKVLVRVDFNVPLDKSTYAVTDSTRIKAAIPTIKKITGDGGTAVLVSHLGRPDGKPEEKYSLKHVVPALKELLGKDVKFCNQCVGEEARKTVEEAGNGEVVLLENLRFHKEEEKGDEAFSRQLAELGDFYVNDAFGTAHRAHASTTIVARHFDGRKAFGFLMADEVGSLEKVLNHAEKPFVAIIGGAKVSDKILIIEQLLNKADSLVIGGGMAYTFLKAQGKEVGNSLCEKDKLDLALRLLDAAKAKGVKFLLPVDSIAADQFAADAATKVTADNISEGWMGLDIGPETIDLYRQEILQAKTILWNGPMGVFEMEAFSKGTKAIAEAVAEATSRGAYSLIGGGDSVAAINKFNLADKVSYVSTGGGAMLEYMEGKTLPGVAAIA